MKISDQPRVLASVFAFLAGLLLCSTAPAQIAGTSSLNVERRGHTATQLSDGKILVGGGENASGPISQAELFDPSSQTHPSSRRGHRAEANSYHSRFLIVALVKLILSKGGI